MEAVEEPLPDKRIGDRERREVDAWLRHAHADGVLTLTEYDERSAQCWAARTRRELDLITHDLPEPAEEPAPPPAPTEPAPGGSGGGGVVKGLIGLAVLAVVGWTGLHAVGADDGLAVFGSRVVQVGPEQDRVEVGVLFGSVEVVVPADARVRTTGRQIFGSIDCDAACDGTGVREVVVDGSGAFGSVDVLRQGERAADRDGGDRDRDADDDDDD